MSSLTNISITFFITSLLLCFVLSSDDLLANENDAESISKIGQGVGHIMNIYYWFVEFINIVFSLLQNSFHNRNQEFPNKVCLVVVCFLSSGTL